MHQRWEGTVGHLEGMVVELIVSILRNHVFLPAGPNEGAGATVYKMRIVIVYSRPMLASVNPNPPGGGAKPFS